MLGNSVFYENGQLVDEEKLFKLIEMLCHPTLDCLRRRMISEPNKTVVGDYLGAVTLNMRERGTSTV